MTGFYPTFWLSHDSKPGLALRKRTLSSQQIQEEYLLVEAAKQDPRSFGKLYERYHHQIFLFVFKRVDDEEIAADLSSQVFLKAMMNLKKYTYKGVPFSAWLFRIASNEIAQHFRKVNKNRVVVLEDRMVKDLEDEFEDKAVLEVNIDVLKSVIQDLKPAEVQLLELRFFEKRPFKEVADILDITENNAKVKIYRLLQKMRKKFEKKQSWYVL